MSAIQSTSSRTQCCRCTSREASPYGQRKLDEQPQGGAAVDAVNDQAQDIVYEREDTVSIQRPSKKREEKQMGTLNVVVHSPPVLACSLSFPAAA